ncbi:MAG: GNAT family N-acetyltransferase, partial [Eubacterium sp.]
MNYIVEQLSISNYDKSNDVWDMKGYPFTEQFKEQIACGNRDAYLMKCNGKYVASCDLVYDYGEYTEASIKIYLSRLIVKKEYRNQGIGQELLKFMIDLCKEKEYQQITVGVDTDNENALHIYQKYGFAVYETATDEYGKYYKMICRLSLHADEKIGSVIMNT